MAMIARRSKLDPTLERWLRNAPPDEPRTVFVRLGTGSDRRLAAQRLKELGVEVQDVASATLIIRVTPTVLRRVGDLAWVLSVEAPQRLGLA